MWEIKVEKSPNKLVKYHLFSLITIKPGGNGYNCAEIEASLAFPLGSANTYISLARVNTLYSSCAFHMLVLCMVAKRLTH